MSHYLFHLHASTKAIHTWSAFAQEKQDDQLWIPPTVRATILVSRHFTDGPCCSAHAFIQEMGMSSAVPFKHSDQVESKSNEAKKNTRCIPAVKARAVSKTRLAFDPMVLHSSDTNDQGVSFLRFTDKLIVPSFTCLNGPNGIVCKAPLAMVV
ncbi:hypothetical protein BASA50_001464 [Batrachochytrium salamandrivorans]|uniref:Uncharacterized protein n=1 Tax=Batrachochytrium salamandrivorans TaxID=1357716 RepID=A0ABQ8FRZ2_9FUNG|nr:hypothetical protein BASA50_001464 [Batrachochytrium salamandrivorans]KAH9269641.1 hypothetical protein BASA83_008300 [Batrachochytrium salamandrivorans]